MTIGIYFIRNTVNNRIYIGQSTNIDVRMNAHISAFSQDDFDKTRTSELLFDDIQKFPIECFEYGILEICDKDNLCERERYLMTYYQSFKEESGYNIRYDYYERNNPNYQKHWGEEARLSMSELKKSHHAEGMGYNDDWKSKLSKRSTEMWKDEVKKSKMAEKVRLSATKYRFIQLSKDGTLIKEWDSMYDIIQEHPDYHVQSIYSVCGGYKKSYKGFLWLKEPKI